MNSKLQPALIGGVALGLLSAIPFVNLVNTCCCLWAIVGGALAVYLYIQRSTTPVKIGDGALTGLLAGAIGAAINLIVGLPLSIATGNAGASAIGGLVSRMSPEAAEAMRQQLELMQSQSFGDQLVSALPGALFGAVLLTIFALIGGLIAVPLFEKRKGDTDMPPPPGFGGGVPPTGNTLGGFATPQAGTDFGAPPNR